MAEGKAFTLKIEGLDTLIADAKKVGGDMPNMLYRAMVNSTTLVQNKAREIRVGSFKNQTGTLRRAIQRRVESAARGLIFIDDSANYGYWVEFGSNPHTIYPKRGKMLKFKVGGKDVFARKVNHPGSKPYPFMEPAYNESADPILEEYAKIGEEIVRTLAK